MKLLYTILPIISARKGTSKVNFLDYSASKVKKHDYP